MDRRKYNAFSTHLVTYRGLNTTVSSQLVPALHPVQPSEVLAPRHERVVVDNVALLILPGMDPAEACTVLVPVMAKEHPVRLADTHPETLSSGLWADHVSKGEGTEPFPLPTAQEGNPGVSEGRTVHRHC